ncbi:MAG: rhodanese-like domain-containing protein [Planctomycetia bacterium]|nr:rhodanese-like domain-containing protein [Planctomycetia bacterium]
MVTIHPSELAAKIQAGENIELLDVRTPAEFNAVHSEFAKNLPLNDLNAAEYLKVRPRADQPLYVICQSGTRGRKACEALQAAGGTSVINVEGGTAAWIAAGLPVVRGRQVISLERQVRIAAGSLVFASVLLGWFVHPYFLGLAAFVGAGLVFAGITDTCGMGLMLARMPWNRVRTATPASCPVPQNT